MSDPLLCHTERVNVIGRIAQNDDIDRLEHMLVTVAPTSVVVPKVYVVVLPVLCPCMVMVGPCGHLVGHVGLDHVQRIVRQGLNEVRLTDFVIADDHDPNLIVDVEASIATGDVGQMESLLYTELLPQEVAGANVVQEPVDERDAQQVLEIKELTDEDDEIVGQ